MISPPPVIAFWPFASAGMLFWGSAAAAPILIHFWSKRKYKEVAWAAMEYLLVAVRRKARRIRIEQLLLLVRASIPLLLALALADPALSLFASLTGVARNGGQTHLVIALDGSYSMSYRRSDKSRFDAARELASRLVEQSDQGDGATLVLMSEPPRTVIGSPAFDPADVIEELQSLRPPHRGAKLSATLAELEAVLQRAEEQHPRLTEHKICFLTDLGRTTWDEATTEDCRRRFSRLGERAELTLVDLGEAASQNGAIVRLDAVDGPIIVGRDLELTAEVQSFGDPRRVTRRIEFLVDGRRAHQAALETAGDEPTVVSFVHRFQAPGEHQVEARLDGDRLEIDNHRWLSVPVRESIRVLCVEGKRGAARYVALALQPEKTERPQIRPDVRPESSLLESDLNDYDSVVLCNISRFGREECNVLFDYLKNGGSLVVFPGDQVQPESYNQELGGELSEKRVLPARIDGLVTGKTYRLDPLGYRHRLTALFRGHERSGLLSTPIWTYLKLTPYGEDAVDVALAFQNGDPAIIEEPILRGRSIMAATAASPQSVNRSADGSSPWTAFASWPSFVPLVQEMIALAVSSRVGGRNLQVGDSFEGSLPGSASNVPVTVVEPGGRDEQVGEHVKVQAHGPDSQWVFHDASWSGVYEAQYGSPVEATQLFAVNLDPRESDLDRLDPELLPHQLRREVQLDDTDQATIPFGKRSRLFRGLLGFVLILLLTETLLAWRFGAATA